MKFSYDLVIDTLTREDYDLKNKAIKECELDAEIWKEILRRVPQAEEEIALYKKLPAEFLDVLAESANSKVRFLVAMKEKISDKARKKLIQDEDESVRIRILYNKKTPIEMIQLIIDQDPEIFVINEAKEVLLRRKLSE